MKLHAGDILEAEVDCATFETDVRSVCSRWKRTLLAVKMKGPNIKVVQIQV